MTKEKLKLVLSPWRMIPYFANSVNPGAEEIALYWIWLADLLDEVPLTDKQVLELKTHVLKTYTKFPAPAVIVQEAWTIAKGPEPENASPRPSSCLLCGDTGWMCVQQSPEDHIGTSIRCKCRGGSGKLGAKVAQVAAPNLDLCPLCQSKGLVEQDGRPTRCTCRNGRELPDVFLEPVAHKGVARSVPPEQTRRALAQLCRVKERKPTKKRKEPLQ